MEKNKLRKVHECIKPWFDLIAVLIAAFALIFTGWSGYETIKHNKLSMRPFIEVSPQFGDKPGQNGVYLDVTGPGTAIIREFTLFVDDQEVNLSSEKNSCEIWHTLLNLKGIDFYFGRIESSTVLPPRYRFPIMRFEKPYNQLTADQQYRISHNLKRLRIYIKYESLYEEVFELNKVIF